MGPYDGLNSAAAYARWRKDRDLALYHLVVERLRRDPGALALAADTLARWRVIVSAHSQPYLVEWEGLFAQGVDRVIEVLEEDTDHAADLRKCGPFAALIDQQDRLAVLAYWSALQPGQSEVERAASAEAWERMQARPYVRDGVEYESLDAYVMATVGASQDPADDQK